MTKLKEVTPGVRIGTPIERHNLSIFPLFAMDVVHAPHYATVGQALRAGSAKITEVSEGGMFQRSRSRTSPTFPCSSSTVKNFSVRDRTASRTLLFLHPVR
jgi:hypothetical protein